jgi:hypothetical protein
MVENMAGQLRPLTGTKVSGKEGTLMGGVDRRLVARVLAKRTAKKTKFR